MSGPIRGYMAGLLINISGMKSFILSGTKEILDGTTAGKVDIDMQP